MTGRRRWLLVLLAVALPVLLAAAALLRPARATTPLKAVATFSIVGDLVKQVGGDRVEVTTLVGPGTDTHDFQPTPQDAVAIASANVLFENGRGFESWLDDIIQNAQAPSLQRITLSQGLPVIETEAEHEGHAEAEHGNPHLWLDVTNTIAYVQTIRETLKQLDPEHSATYDANAERYLTLLRDLDSSISREVATIPAAKRKLMTFHDAWPYFCQRYGLQSFTVLQANPESELSAQQYAELVGLIRREQVTVIFGEAGFNPKLIRQLSQDTGITFVDSLHGDTLATAGLSATYIGMMQHNASAIVNALR